jgi:YbbR domain-containing protein
MNPVRNWITHNWFLKLLSFGFAMTLWVAVASETSSEIGIEVPLEYRNVPAQMEITGDAANTVEVRLRGAANVVKDITPKQVSTTVDLSHVIPGERTIMLTAQNVQVPFGTEVIRISPSQVRISIEQTISKMVSVVPTTQGQPADGLEVGNVMISPGKVRLQGPESRIASVDSVSTDPINVSGKSTSFQQSVGLELPDPQLRIPEPSRVDVRIEIRKTPR